MTNETPKKYVSHVLSGALSNLKLTPEPEKIDITIPDPGFGDYSTNVALVLAKKLGRSPKDLAEDIVNEAKKEDKDKVFESIESKGGFINFKLSASYLKENLKRILFDTQKWINVLDKFGKTVVVEYFQNNVAKPPHVGHLRSAVIGDSLVRALISQGYKVVSDTHIGDWGVQFGILIFAYKEYIKNGGKKEGIEKDPINEFNKLYVDISSKIEQDPSLRDKGKEEFVKLEKGDKENRELWQWFVDVSNEDFFRYAKMLKLVEFSHNLGESFYEDKMPAVLEELKSKGLVKTGETGEQYVDLEEHGLGRCILVKSGGGTTYHLRDIATYLFRKKEFEFEKNIYVVDVRQSHHFKQLFKVFDLAGYPASQDSMHVPFGFMSMPEGAISTRKGNAISLEALIDEAKARALNIINEKNPKLREKQQVAEYVALAAIKYFDLSHNRNSEIVFEWDKALSFEGNTGPYLQYVYARIMSIFGKYQEASGKGVDMRFAAYDNKMPNYDPAGLELDLMRKLSAYPETVALVAEEFLPNMLTNYLFELSQLFNRFYEEVPVIKEENEDAQLFRFFLLNAVAAVLWEGLSTLGIQAPHEM